MPSGTRAVTLTAKAAREISYASSAATPSGRAAIRLIENATGRLGLIRRARGYEADMAAGKVSLASPIALALMRARVGDEVRVHTPRGVEVVEVLEIRYPG